MSDALVHGRPAVFLLAEDRDDERIIGFERASFAADRTRLVRDGDAPTFDIVLLALDTPRIEEINGRTPEPCRCTALTSSQADEDIPRSPVTFDASAKVNQSFGDDWLTLVKLA